MKKALSAVVGLAILASGASFAGAKGGHGPHWGYSGDAGPANWGKLKEEYALCGRGRNQSPINIADSVEAQLPEIKISYDATPLKALNNGHTIQANYGPGSSIEVDGIQFDLLQFHFHSPSENVFNGENFPMEAHFVHKDKDGNLAVIGVMFKEGANNPVVDLVWNNLPTEINKMNALDSTWFNGVDMLPAKHDYYRFSGSLTTPPCSEGVRWLVMKEPVEISKAQVDKFLSIIGENARPLQGMHARRIMK
ncbi:carbonic anhydrase [Pseudomonadota bacterium]